VQGPEPYITELGITLACPVDPDETAILDPAHRVLLNYEAYYMSSAQALERFRQAPHRYTGAVTDPVSRNRFQPDEGSPATIYDARTFLFESAETLERFQASPDDFATPMIGMVTKP